jgi:hypothetical protein
LTTKSCWLPGGARPSHRRRYFFRAGAIDSTAHGTPSYKSLEDTHLVFHSPRPHARAFSLLSDTGRDEFEHSVNLMSVAKPKNRQTTK